MSFRGLLFLSAAIMASVVAGRIAVSDALAPNPVNLTPGFPAVSIIPSETRSAACLIWRANMRRCHASR